MTNNNDDDSLKYVKKYVDDVIAAAKNVDLPKFKQTLTKEEKAQLDELAEFLEEILAYDLKDFETWKSEVQKLIASHPACESESCPIMINITDQQLRFRFDRGETPDQVFATVSTVYKHAGW